MRLSVTHSASPLGLVGDHGIGYITIDGKRAFNCGNNCTTCSFFFESLEGATKIQSPAGFQYRLSEGISRITEHDAELLKELLPIGYYELLLFEEVPRFITPGSDDDYFCKEQAALWGDYEERCKTPYYRTGETDLGLGERVFEFVIPMLLEGGLDEKRVGEFCAKIENGARPTALVFSMLF